MSERCAVTEDLNRHLAEQEAQHAKADAYELHEEEAVQLVVEGDEEFIDHSVDFYSEITDDHAMWGELQVFMRTINMDALSPDLRGIAARRLYDYINDQAKGSDEVESVCDQLVKQGQE